MKEGQGTPDGYREALTAACHILRDAGRVLILSHLSPDGDTIGSAFALGRALLRRGHTVRIECSDAFPPKYDYLTRGLAFPEFEPDTIVTTDIASENLFGERLARYIGRVDLCIDHHPSNSRYASHTLLNPRAAATCEIIPDILDTLGVPLDPVISNCIYTGIATDTGCFRYPNTTPATLRLAARLIDSGADAVLINKRMFETVSRQRLKLETMVLGTLEYHFGGQAAVITVTHEMCEQTGLDESDLEGIPSLPSRIEGVLAGITIKEKGDGLIKVSVRTNGRVNASNICAQLGGGGHANAAGCSLESCTVRQARDTVLAAVEKALADRE